MSLIRFRDSAWLIFILGLLVLSNMRALDMGTQRADGSQVVINSHSTRRRALIKILLQNIAELCLPVTQSFSDHLSGVVEMYPCIPIPLSSNCADGMAVFLFKLCAKENRARGAIDILRSVPLERNSLRRVADLVLACLVSELESCGICCRRLRGKFYGEDGKAPWRELSFCQKHLQLVNSISNLVGLMLRPSRPKQAVPARYSSLKKVGISRKESGSSKHVQFANGATRHQFERVRRPWWLLCCS